MKVLVACETSGRVRDAFAELGHDAISCDLLPTDNEGPHYQGDVRDLLHNGFDLMVAHPPCTYICSSGMHWTTRGMRDPKLTEYAMELVQILMDAPIPRICIENPVGIISTRIRKPDQIIHPWQFGEDASKRTCLWLKGLQPLEHTQYVAPRYVCPCGANYPGLDQDTECEECGTMYRHFRCRWSNQLDSGQNRLRPSADRWKQRSETYRGIAKAMAQQWSNS
jgi:hypothetical protein